MMLDTTGDGLPRTLVESLPMQQIRQVFEALLPPAQ
jgi:hypothetical protein